MMGLCFLFRESIEGGKNLILCYHDPRPEVFRKHLFYLVTRYNIISLDTLVDAIKQKQWQVIPPKSLVITIDDGVIGNYELLNVIREFDVPVTIFLTSGIVNTNRRFWFRAGYQQNQRLKIVSNETRLDVLKQAVGYEETKEERERQALNIQEIQEMTKGGVSFESHTCFHPCLPQCSDEKCLAEIRDSKESLERLLKKPIRHFAYPNGDFTKREMDFLQQCGYESAVCMQMGWNREDSDLFALKRIGISDTASINELAGELSGVFGTIRNFYRYCIGLLRLRPYVEPTMRQA